MDIYTIYADHTLDTNAKTFARRMKKFLDKMVDLGRIESYRLSRMKLGFRSMNMPEFREFTKTLADQGVDRKTIRLVRKVWRAGKFNQFMDAAAEAQGSLMDRVGATVGASE